MFACALPPPELRRRRVEVLADVRRKVLRIDETTDGFIFTFVRSTELIAELEEFIRFEAACCSFITMALADAGESEVELRMTAPHGAKPFIRGMRITVRRVLDILATYPQRQDIFREYPFLEEEDLRQALITIAISVILADQMVAHFGGIAQSIAQPASWPESVNLFGLRYGFFRLVVVVGAAVLIGSLLFLVIKMTRFGMIIRAGVDDRAMVSALGVNIQLVFAGAFFLGALLAGIAGVLGGTMIAVQPGLDSAFLLNSLIVVIIGGMGSLAGAAIGSVALGLVTAYADVYLKFGATDLTPYAILVTFLLVVAMLAIRPLGLFGRPA